jgi:geranylgeranyl pyrophosphate synthase
MVRAPAGTLPEPLWEQALRGPLRAFLSRPGKASHARFVELAFCAAGGEAGAHPPELPLLIESLHAGSLIIDDIEDGSDERRGAPTLHRQYGVPIALNAGNWLYFHAYELLARMRLPSDAAKLAAFAHVSRWLLRCHEGQALDLSARATELAQQDVGPVTTLIAHAKTGGLLALGMGLSAIAAGAGEDVQHALSDFGATVGASIQMLDDLSGVVDVRRRNKAIEDLRHARATFLWAWLAHDASSELYRACQARLRAVVAGDDPAELIEVLRFRVVAHGRVRARKQLADAASALRNAFGERSLLPALELELALLEARYLEGEA